MKFTLNLRSAIVPCAARGIRRAGAIMLAGGVSLSFLMIATDTISVRPQWQEQLVRVNDAPKAYALGVSAQQLFDGGYVLGGNILGYGGSYIQHALMQ